MSIRALRVLVTIYLAFSIGQAGLASGYLGGREDILLFHNINSFLVVGLGVACLVGGILYQKDGGPWWPTIFAGALIAVSVLQAILGQTAIVGPHIFLGVLFLCGVTTYCSYVWRHTPVPTSPAKSAPAAQPAPKSSAA